MGDPECVCHCPAVQATEAACEFANCSREDLDSMSLCPLQDTRAMMLIWHRIQSPPSLSIAFVARWVAWSPNHKALAEVATRVQVDRALHRLRPPGCRLPSRHSLVKDLLLVLRAWGCCSPCLRERSWGCFSGFEGVVVGIRDRKCLRSMMIQSEGKERVVISEWKSDGMAVKNKCPKVYKETRIENYQNRRSCVHVRSNPAPVVE